MIAVDTAIEVACKATGIKPDDLLSPTRNEEHVDARCIVYKLLKELNQWGYERIGRIFDKHHTTIMYGVKRADKSIETNGTLGQMYRECKERVNGS